MLIDATNIEYTVQTSYVQLKWDTHVLLCEPICLRVPTCVSNIIITNLQPLSINFLFPYPFTQSSTHAERC